MHSVISSTVLATAVLGQVALGGVVVGHSHARFHEKKDVNVLSSLLSTSNILTGANPTYSEDAPIGLGEGGPFQVELQNNGTEDIAVVVWSGFDQASTEVAMGVAVTQPNITYHLASGSSQIVSFNPDKHTNSQISGALAPVYSGQTLSFAGQVDQTWVEFTFETADTSSTLDVSRLINMNGNPITVKNYPAAPTNGEEPACTSDMNTCVYACPEGAATCVYAGIQNCGGAGTTAGNGWDGGCAGFSQTGGYSTVTFY